jgi:hypothetical protein
MHVLLEVLRTLQAAGFQYFVDLEDLINNFLYPSKTITSGVCILRALHLQIF